MRVPSASVRRTLVLGCVALLGVGGLLFVLYRASPFLHPAPGCTASLRTGPTGGPDAVSDFALSVEQAENGATIAAVGTKMGMPDHAVTVAIATALQESGLHNLRYGDRDSIGLFQQRPSQGWGTVAQISDPVYSATAFYQRLRQQRNWTTLEVTDAAQLVQHSAEPQAYAQWEPQARAMAAALTGEAEASLACHDVKPGPAREALITVAKQELGSSALTGQHEPGRSWALGNWLVAHAVRLGIDQVTANGRTWSSESGGWEPSGPADGVLRLHQVVPST